MASNRKAVALAQPPVSLIPPENWTAAERRLVSQIDQIFRDVYRRWGRLGLTDLSIALRGAFDRTVTLDNFESVFQQTANSLSVQFGTPGEVQGPSLEVSRDRMYARVPEIDLVVTDASGKNQLVRFRSRNGRFEVERLSVVELECPTIVRWDLEYNWLPTASKTIPGAFYELVEEINALKERIDILENPPEV